MKDDLKWKLANIVVGVTREKQCVIVLEKLGKNMINRVRDSRIRHRLY